MCREYSVKDNVIGGLFNAKSVVQPGESIWHIAQR